jgi:hypothetical protein
VDALACGTAALERVHGLLDSTSATIRTRDELLAAAAV